MADQAALISQLQKRIEILEDKEALAALLDRYCNTADVRDWEGYPNTYIDDVVMTFESWGDTVGKAASAESVFEGLQHMMANMQFEVDGSDKATGTAYLWFCATPETSRPEINYSFVGPYRFEFVRTSEGWRISRMRLRRTWAHGQDTKKVFGPS